MNEIYERITSIIEDIADIPKDEMEPESSLLTDLDLASLEIMSIVSKIEKEFSIKISEQDLLSIETIQDFMDTITSKNI